MEPHVRQRLVGAVVLAALAVIFIPLFFKGSSSPAPQQVTISAEIPPAPAKPTVPVAQSILAGQNTALNQPQDMTVAATKTVATNPNTVATTTTAANPNQLAFGHGMVATPQTVSSSATEPTQQSSQQLSTKQAQQPPVVVTETPSVTAPEEAEATPTQTASTKMNEPVPTAWTIQLGSFSNALNAKQLETELRARGFIAYTRVVKTAVGSTMHRVYIGPETQRDKATAIETKLSNEMHLKGVVVAFETQ